VVFNRSVKVVFLFCVVLFSCKTQNKNYYTPTIVCELKTPDEKITLRSQVKFSADNKTEELNIVNRMYEVLFFNGLRQNNCEINQIIIGANPKIDHKEFLNNFWIDTSREGRFHRILSKKKNKNSTTTYYIEFDINKLKKHLNENNIK